MIDTNLFIENIEKIKSGEISWGYLHIEFDCPEWNYADADAMFDICARHGIEPEYINNKYGKYIGYLSDSGRISDLMKASLSVYEEYIALCRKYVFGSAMINHEIMNDMIKKSIENFMKNREITDDKNECYIEWSYMYMIAGHPRWTEIDYKKMMQICNTHGIEPHVYEGENGDFVFIGYLLFIE